MNPLLLLLGAVAGIGGTVWAKRRATSFYQSGTLTNTDAGTTGGSGSYSDTMGGAWQAMLDMTKTKAAASSGDLAATLAAGLATARMENLANKGALQKQYNLANKTIGLENKFAHETASQGALAHLMTIATGGKGLDAQGGIHLGYSKIGDNILLTDIGRYATGLHKEGGNIDTMMTSHGLMTLAEGRGVTGFKRGQIGKIDKKGNWQGLVHPSLRSGPAPAKPTKKGTLA